MREEGYADPSKDKDNKSQQTGVCRTIILNIKYMHYHQILLFFYALRIFKIFIYLEI